MCSNLDDMLSNIVPESLCQRSLAQAHRLWLADQLGDTSLYHNLRRDFFCHLLAHDIFMYVAKCTLRTETHGDIRQHFWFMKLFPLACPIAFVAINVLGPLSETNKEKLYHGSYRTVYEAHERNLSQKHHLTSPGGSFTSLLVVSLSCISLSTHR